MAASAALTIPVDATTPARADAISEVLASALGASEVDVDSSAGKATLRYKFPGDLDTIMRELQRRGLTHTATCALAVRLARADGGSPNPSEVVVRFSALPAVSNVSFDAGILCATVAAASAALRSLHASITAADLVAVDIAAPRRA